MTDEDRPLNVKPLAESSMDPEDWSRFRELAHEILDNTPERKEQLHAALDEAENFSLSQFDSSLFEAMIVLAGKGTKPDQIKKGIEIVGTLQIKQSEEYFQRLRPAGVEERIAEIARLLGPRARDHEILYSVRILKKRGARIRAVEPGAS